MKKISRIIAGFISFMLVASATACSKEEVPQDSISETQENNIIETVATEEISNITTTPTGEEIYWLADYDINPLNTQNRSIALSLFEDQYGGKVNWIWCNADSKYEVLTSRLLSDEPVDMVSYDEFSMPQGVMKDLFQPLDNYLDLNDSIWDSMRDDMNAFAYQGQHYVVPYAVSEPLLMIYSRKLCQENNLDDPYELYQSGNWTWESFKNMMQSFVSNGSDRYGVCGFLGKGILQSTGKKIVDFDGNQFTNNLNDDSITTAENFLQEIGSANLYDATWYSNFPTKNNILFYAMQDWALDKSNAVNPDGDFMAVPFPKAPDSDNYYLSGNYEAKMLVKNSTKGDAVATYIYCERLAQTEETYQQIAKQNALQQEVSQVGAILSYRTEEQYQAILSYQQNLKNISDFGYGFDTSGTIMNPITNGVLDGVQTWDSINTGINDSLTSAISELQG
ncbi:MAG: ABC transporter substrate-binding protein [Oscillospiraceae bacterium]|nr:ABC transporter substrate-binding protein [Oscillospiraceae bacterium]